MKNTELDVDFEAVEVAKNSCEKIYQQKSDRKMKFFT